MGNNIILGGLLLLLVVGRLYSLEDNAIWRKMIFYDDKWRVGACEYEIYAGEKFTTSALKTTEVSDSPDLPSDSLNWYFSLHPTLQTRIIKPIRREYRQLNKEERNRLTGALWKLHSTEIDGMTQFNIFLNLHDENVAPGSTRIGPAQFGWHREYMLRFEEALRRFEPDLTLPYWDLTIDNNLATIRDSVLWTDEVWGECLGGEDGEPTEVVDGPYANWAVPGDCIFGNGTLQRNCGYDFQYHGFTDIEMDILMNTSYSSFEEWYYEFSACFTRDHDYAHAFVGGHLHDLNVDCVVADPVSWYLHTYIDLFWEEYRVNVQKTDLETDYPKNVANEYHESTNIMRPFYGLYNLDGYSTDYTTYLYGYEKRKTDCAVSADCGNTEFIFCDSKNSKCVSKIQSGGVCDNYDEVEEACGQTGACTTTEKDSKTFKTCGEEVRRLKDEASSDSAIPDNFQNRNDMQQQQPFPDFGPERFQKLFGQQ